MDKRKTELPAITSQPVPQPRFSYTSGEEKVTGRARYTFDLRMPGMLVGKCLYAEYPRAGIARLDTSAAARIPGVAAVVTHEDLPGEKTFGYIVKDQPFIAIDEVCTVADVVAAVAAETEKLAQAALDAIEVEYEPMSGVFDLVSAAKPGAPLARSNLESNILSHTPIVFGDSAIAFRQSTVVIEQTFKTACVDQLFLETEGTLALWDGDVLTIYTGGQSPHRDRIQIAEAMGVPANRVRVVYPYVGGGFGGKDELHTQVHAALLARKSGRPVKLIRSRAESLSTHVKRETSVIRFKLGADQEGRFTAVEVEAYLDAGPYTNASLAIAGFIAEHASGPYNIPNAQINAFAVATNNLPGGAMRGFGGPEIAFAQEQCVDIMANRLAMDPIDLRLLNAIDKDSLMPTGVYFCHEIGLRKTIESAAEAVRWRERDTWLDRQPGQNLRRGLGMATVMHGMGISPYLMDYSRASLEMAPDGTVTLLSGTSDIGSGARTAQAILAAQELGVELDDIRLVNPDTGTVPDAGPTVASRSTYMMGNAVLQAAAPIRSSLLDVASEQLEVAPEDLCMAGGKIWVRGVPKDRGISLAEAARGAWESNKPLRGEGHAVMWMPDMPEHEILYPPAHSIYNYATQIAQVLVDIETGQIRVEKVWSAHDVGKALNMLGIEGQIDGGVVQGIGTALMEELAMEDGRLAGPSLEAYLVPSARDIPEVIPIVLEVPEPSGPHGARGLAEATFVPTAAAIANAITDAIGARPCSIPITPGKLLAAIGEASLQEAGECEG